MKSTKNTTTELVDMIHSEFDNAVEKLVRLKKQAKNMNALRTLKKLLH